METTLDGSPVDNNFLFVDNKEQGKTTRATYYPEQSRQWSEITYAVTGSAIRASVPANITDMPDAQGHKEKVHQPEPNKGLWKGEGSGGKGLMEQVTALQPSGSSPSLNSENQAIVPVAEVAMQWVGIMDQILHLTEEAEAIKQGWHEQEKREEHFQGFNRFTEITKKIEALKIAYN